MCGRTGLTCFAIEYTAGNLQERHENLVGDEQNKDAGSEELGPSPRRREVFLNWLDQEFPEEPNFDENEDGEESVVYTLESDSGETVSVADVGSR
jgi:hypothetical protein